MILTETGEAMTSQNEAMLNPMAGQTTKWKLREMNPADLKNHLISVEIYGSQSLDGGMLASIKEFGVLEPLRATQDGVLLSGHRRRQHAIAANLPTVPVLVAEHAISEAEQVIEIVESNRQREKTMEQKAREYARLADAKAELAHIRQVSNLKKGKESPVGEIISEREKGRAKEQAAAEIGVSRPTAEKAVEVVEVIDERMAAGDTTGAAELRSMLNERNVAAAHRAAIPEAGDAAGVRKPRKSKAQTNGQVREPGEDLPEPQHDPKRPTDKSGNALPDRPELLRAFSSRDLFHSCGAAYNVIYNNCYQIAGLIPDGQALKDAVDKIMKGLFHTLGSFEPCYVCRTCGGNGCPQCHARGYTTKPSSSS